MKLGTEKKGEVIALVVLLLVAVVMLWRTLAPGPDASAPAASAPAASGGAATSAHSGNVDPTLHMARLQALRAITYTGNGRDLFHFGSSPALSQGPSPSELAKAAQLAKASRPAPPAGPPQPPPPPPIPLKFYGYAVSANAPEKIFLQEGEDSYVVAQGDTIDHRYLIESIGKISVRVKDLQTNSEQELPLQQG